MSIELFKRYFTVLSDSQWNLLLEKGSTSLFCVLPLENICMSSLLSFSRFKEAEKGKRKVAMSGQMVGIIHFSQEQ